jgi:hypothetical protein
MKRMLSVTGKAVVMLLIATQTLAQETVGVADVAELKKLIEEGLLRVYGQHYVYRQDTDWQGIGFDFAYDTNLFKPFPQTDNVQAGRVAADGLAAAIKTKYGKAEGDVALISLSPAVEGLDQRAKGFKEQIAEKYPRLNLIADKVVDGKATSALNVMTNLITAKPNLRGVFASDLIIAQGAGQAIAENRVVDKIKLVGFDSEAKPVKLVSRNSSNTYAMKRQKRGDTASGVVVVRENAMISIDITPCRPEKEIVTFFMPYKETQISEVNCGKDNTYQQSQVIQQ